ncbi:MAG: cytochrome c [Trueperaceae bacterium]|nr:cytochrome c [Trueperaceae bacterium]
MSKKSRQQSSPTTSDQAKPGHSRFIDQHFGKLIAVVLVVGGLINAVIWFAPNQSPQNTAATLAVSSEVLERGEALYAQTCATCHGVRGQGYANAALPAPALNGSEHAWHHSDAQIEGWLRNGNRQMPAVARSWSDEEIDAVLSYIKAWWEPEQRAYQAGLSQ